MNTDGPLGGRSARSYEPASNDRRTAVERVAPSGPSRAGVARSVNLFESTAGRAYAVQTIGYARELTRELKIIGIRGRFAWGVEAMPVFAQFGPSSDLRRRLRAGGVAMELSAAADVVGVRGTVDGRDVDDASRFRKRPAAAISRAHWGGGVRAAGRAARHALTARVSFSAFLERQPARLQSRRQQPCVSGRLVSPLD